jgi:hypothetical protein
MIVSGIEVSGVCARSAPVFPGREEIILKHYPNARKNNRTNGNPRYQRNP